MIVHVITGLRRGGAENALFRLLSSLDDPSSVRVVSLADGGIFKERLESMGVRVVCLGMRAGLPSPTALWALVRLLREWRPSMVQTWMYHADLVGGMAARLAGIPVCWGVRQSDLAADMNKRNTLAVARACAFLSRWVPRAAISCSDRAAKAHRALGYRVPFHIVPNGIDAGAWKPRPELREVARAELGIPPEAFVFAHAGRNDPQKDHANLVRAFSVVLAVHPGVRLLMCGTGLAAGDRYLEGLPFVSDSRAATVAVGPRDDLPRIWQAADVFVLSSSGEAFPNVVAEAMACAVPAIVTDVGDAAEIVGDTGWIVPPHDHQALADAMLASMKMTASERATRGTRARARIESLFTIDRMVHGFQRVWDDVLSRGRKQCVD